jgi:two-component system chemotaxis response regulator CheB
VTDKIRVLVVDDSMVMRRVVSDILAAEPDLDVQPPAAGGALALARLDAGAIDVVVLDVEMPGMSGLDVLAELRKRNPSPMVIMFSASTQKAASITLEALLLGASDYVTKPSGTGSAAASVELVRTQLLPKIRALGRRTQARLSATTNTTTTTTTTNTTTTTAPSSVPTTTKPLAAVKSDSSSPWPINPPLQATTTTATPSGSFGTRTPSTAIRAPSGTFGGRANSGSFGARTPSGSFGGRSTAPASAPIEILAIGTSTGGPNALGVLLHELPATFPVPIVIVQHMPPLFTKMLAERLTATTPIPVVEVTHGQVILPGHAYLAPGDQHMVLQRQGVNVVALLNKDPPEQSCRPSVDVLFRSVAATYAARTLAVVLTGMGQDGLVGCQTLRAAGAQIVVQDEASSVVWGMPGFVARAGIADAVKPLADLPMEILRRLRGAGSMPQKAGTPWP